ncbi:hypothetical protein IMSAGC017_01206 [Thomasclavelia cocleata]|uniref:HTH cro/C1-type domain-containing protein n=1 Tax=Thomasclavelia cocleata TaxID=69824 RepID=A0A829Z9Y2_9FIRM|nr:helix-turn-helix transcriptional regulator [Thomasclavelia cocleata]MDE6952819.1 helix-turn-helix transcriptional regulator [Erysipelotrichales bacterium]GFI41163.1 hypothetical protein IMSAGC017_01206 [Thomasclavelia cocleata]
MVKIHLSKLLGERKMSQAELARRTGIRPSTINEIYWELIERINLEHIDLICKELGCTIQDFMELSYEEDELRERVKLREKYYKKI